MGNDLKNELKNIFKDTGLDDASFDKIIQVFTESVNAKAQAQVEVALEEQDKVFSEQLKLFINKLDASHSEKLSHLVEALENNYVKKLKILKEKYDEKYKKAFVNFKDNLIDTNQSFINMYLNKVVPQDVVTESVKIKKQENLINNIRKLLAVNSVTEREMVKDGILEAKKIINEAHDEIEKLKKEKSLLAEQLNTQKRDILLEKKLSKVAPEKRNTLYKIYKDKSINQINEQFDYSSRLLDRQIKNEKKNIVNNILEKRSKEGEFINQPTKVLNENINNLNNSNNQSLTLMDDYVAELQK